MRHRYRSKIIKEMERNVDAASNRETSVISAIEMSEEKNNNKTLVRILFIAVVLFSRN